MTALRSKLLLRGHVPVDPNRPTMETCVCLAGRPVDVEALLLHRMDETRTSETKKTWRYLVSMTLGGLGGAVGIIVAVIADLDWECRYRNSGCNDGQGGIVLVVLVPAMFVVGTLFGSLWPWLKAKIPPSSILAQNYTGTRKVQSQIIGWTLPLGLWCLVCFGLFLLLIFLSRF
jgi:hypothetical protein